MSSSIPLEVHLPWLGRTVPVHWEYHALLMFGVYVIWPIFESIGISLYDWDGLGTPEFIGLDNYRELTTDPDFFVALKNNLIWLVGFLLAVPAGLFLALFLNQTVFGIRIVKSLFFFPFVISQVVIGLVFTWFYNPANGLVGKLFALVGMEPVSVLALEPASALVLALVSGLASALVSARV